MSRLAACTVLLAVAGGAAVLGCGFGLADDTGKAIPADYWKWTCPDGGTPAADAGCKADASVSKILAPPSS
ncbi:MAG TPA: hypothetical protein VLT58_09995 [Polyangia bacterium]|nr:hypothetical protein [Polyangia bacterium]